MDEEPTLPLNFVESASRLEVAVYYARTFGWSVFPLPVGGREPYPGSRGFLDATNDPQRVGELWNLRDNDSNIAMATGPASGLLVIDVDAHEGGADGAGSLATLEAEHGKLPRTLTAQTPRGGKHLFFKYPIDGRWGNTAGRIAPGIDTRGDGGYAILSPSVVQYGPYRWVDTHVPVDIPEWVLGLLAKRSYEHEAQEAEWDRSDDDVSRYVRAAVADEAAELAGMAEGGRNDRLNRAAYSLGTIGAHGVLSEDYARTALLAACEACGLLASSGLMSCLATFASGWNAGMKSPRQPWPPKPMQDTDGLDFGPAPGTRESEASGRPDPGVFFDKVDGLLAEEVARQVFSVGPIRVDIGGQFWSYHEGVWRHDPKVVHKRVARLLRNRYRNAHADNVAALIKFTVQEITCEPISSHINCRSGMLDWATGEIAPHSPKWGSTIQLPWDWDAEATSPEFDRFLAEVVPPDMIPTMWEFIGYMMYSGNPLQKAFMMLGKGGNGKGTLIRVLSALLGPGNISAVTLDSLATNRFSPASLYGKLANIAGDIDATYQESTAMFKKICGEDSIDAERKYGDAFNFTPWAVPVFSANKVPGSADTTTGYTRRWIILPFPNHFEGKDADAQLTTRLVAEVPGIARRGVAALRDLMMRGYFELPASATDAKEDFARRIDVVRGWVADACDTTPGSFTSRSVLYLSFKHWAQLNGHKVLRSTEFYDRLEGAGFRATKRMGTRGFCDITVSEGRVSAAGFEWNGPNTPDD